MSFTTNLYSRALQIGYEKINSGISYTDLFQLLSSEDYVIDERSFRNWFFKEFSISGEKNIVPISYLKDLQDGASFSANHWNPYVTYVGFLKAEGVMRLMEFVELEEARESSHKASNQARSALIISIISIVIGIVFSALELVFE